MILVKQLQNVRNTYTIHQQQLTVSFYTHTVLNHFYTGNVSKTLSVIIMSVNYDCNTNNIEWQSHNALTKNTVCHHHSCNRRQIITVTILLALYCNVKNSRTHRKSVVSERCTKLVLLVQLLFAADHVLDKVQRLWKQTAHFTNQYYMTCNTDLWNVLGNLPSKRKYM